MPTPDEVKELAEIMGKALLEPLAKRVVILLLNQNFLMPVLDPEDPKDEKGLISKIGERPDSLVGIFAEILANQQYLIALGEDLLDALDEPPPPPSRRDRNRKKQKQRGRQKQRQRRVCEEDEDVDLED